MARSHNRRSLVIIAALLGVISVAVLSAYGDKAPRMPKPAASHVAVGSSHSEKPIGGKARVRAVPWGIARLQGPHIMLGTTLPYCGYSERPPSIHRIGRRDVADGIVLTMFVRFPEVRASGCVGIDLGLSRWVTVDGQANRLHVYDGSTSPPTRRTLRNAPNPSA